MKKPLLAIIAALAAIVALWLPLAVLFAHSPWATVVLAARSEQDAIWNSVVSSLISLVVIVLIGTPASAGMARGRGRLWRAAEALNLVPLMTPPIVIGLVLMFVFGPYTPIGRVVSAAGGSVTNSLAALILAQVYEALPYYLLGATAAFRQVDPALERAALTLGATPSKTFWRVSLPLAAPGLTAALAMTSARVIGAFGAVLVIAYNPRSLPIAVWVTLQDEGLFAALPVAALLLLIALPLPLLLIYWGRSRNDRSTA